MAPDRKGISLLAVAGRFARLGVIGFGGPAAHVALMHREFVKRLHWIDEKRFLDHFAMTNLIPGPNSTELAMILGKEAAGLPGLIVAGASFIIPAATIVLALAYAYVEYGSTPAGEGLMYGIEPVVIAVVLHALIDLGRESLRRTSLATIAIGAATAYLLGVNELLVLFAGGIVMLLPRITRSNAVIALPSEPSRLHPPTTSRSSGSSSCSSRSARSSTAAATYCWHSCAATLLSASAGSPSSS